MTLSKSVEEYEKGGGWSSSLFYKSAMVIFKKLQKADYTVDVGRTVVYISKGRHKLKAYVHYNGRSKEYLTITDGKGTELETFHYTDSADKIYNGIINKFN
jgi:hypothetical protein